MDEAPNGPLAGPPAGPTLRPATAADLPFILRGERSYIREIEPAAEAGWTNALDRNLQLWVDNLERAAIVEVAGEPVGYYLWMPDAGARGAARLLLGVHRDNPARLLYEQSGFTFTGTDGGYLNYQAMP
ncbi:hypothetical protein ACQCSX_16585 [Pseudarthrobacter sp. P1]|uniref:hypothetical protein n=1 Tax=Pseudarthrobacter sp. P1 TaxID=3418418 RepID=UPI003CEC7456